jgi:hypothetical protein
MAAAFVQTIGSYVTGINAGITTNAFGSAIAAGNAILFTIYL